MPSAGDRLRLGFFKYSKRRLYFFSHLGPTAATSLKLLLLPLVLLTASGFILRAFVSALGGCVCAGGGNSSRHRAV